MTFAAAVAALREAGVADPQRDAQKLRDVSVQRGVDFAALIARRAAREPMSHIIGGRAFWTSVFEVSADVLDPRPDTEKLVEAALAQPWQRVLDLGTGSGCILLSLLKERDGSTGLGVDISAAALEVAKRNAAALGLSEYAQFLQSDWFGDVDGTFDLIVSNPPYITADAFAQLQPEVRNHEPKVALTPGGDGQDPYRVIIAQAPGYLTPNGHLMVEIGYDQAAPVQAMFVDAGFTDVQVIGDLNGKDRVVRAVMR